METNIICDQIGSVILEVPSLGKSFVCNDCTINMGMNKIPTADITLKFGTSLKSEYSEYNNDPEILLETIAKTSGKYTASLGCYIYEINNNNSIKIFDGYIIAGSMSCSSNAAGSDKVVNISCMNKACLLYTKPIGDYINMNIADAAAIINYNAKNNPEVALQSSSAWESNKLSLQSVLAEIIPTINNADMATRIAVIVEAVVKMFTYRPENFGDSFSSVSDVYDSVMGVLYSATNLSLSPKFSDLMDQSVCSREFNEQIVQYMCQTLPKASIFESILSILNSTQYMLNLAPRGYNYDFKLEIIPPENRGNTAAISLYPDNILGFSINYAPFSTINSPDAFVINFSDSIGSTNDATRAAIYNDRSGLNGVFSLDPEITKYIRDVYNNNLHSINPLMPIKVKFYDAPRWLAATGLSELKVNNWAGIITTKTGIKESAPSMMSIAADSTIIADAIAEAVFLFIYGSSDVASFKLNPNIRFGKSNEVGNLEDSIGKTVDVFINSSMAYTDSVSYSNRNMRGVLENVRYSYHAGSDMGSSNVSYDITLSRIRPYSEDEFSLVNPIYINNMR